LTEYPANRMIAPKTTVHRMRDRTMIRFQSLDHKQDI